MWMSEFLALGGLDVLMSALEILSTRISSQNAHLSLMDTCVSLQCVQCIKAVLSSHAGVEHFASSRELVFQLVKGKDF